VPGSPRESPLTAPVGDDARMPGGGQAEVKRLETLWSGEFGDRYVDRNRDVAGGRGPFWHQLHERFPFASALEVGCNVGANLQWLAGLLDARAVYGTEINATALRELRTRLPDVNALHATARSLPFRDGLFDLTFTVAVLIHQPPETLPIAMSEIVRCSRRYVLCGELYAETPQEVAYHGEHGALFKRDWGALYQSLFPELELLDRRFLGTDEGWGDVTFWLFEKH
jgi:pseudaminic acid biosynthesis-associated methylase